MNSLRYSCYLLTIDQVSTDHRPSVDQWLTDTSVKYRRTIGKVSAKSRRSVGEVSVNKKLYRPRHIWKDYWPCLDRVSSDYRPSLDRLSTDYRPLYRPTIDRLSTEYRPSVEWVLTECRPSVDRLSTAISTGTYRSTLPTVNMILKVYCRVNELQTRHWQERTIIPGLNWGRKKQCVVQDVFRRKVCPNTWCILCPSLYLRRITRRTTNVCSSSSRWIINSREIRLHFPFSGNWNKPDKDWKKGNSF